MNVLAFMKIGKDTKGIVGIDYISKNTLLKFFTFFCRMLKSVQHNPGVFSVNPDKLKPLEKWIMKIEGQILDGLIFDVCI
jgi:hypothetical protein